MRSFVFIFVPYFTLVVFILGMAYRFVSWSRTPQPGKMTLFPAPRSGAWTVIGIVKESFFFTGLFRGDKSLWFIAWIFHAALALIIVGHVRVFTDFPALWAALGIDADRMSAIFGGAAGIIILLMVILLLLRRFIIRQVREISNFPDYFAVLLLCGILITGNAMRFGEHFDLELTRNYFAHLFTFSYAGMTIPDNPLFSLHFLLAQLLIVYIPFSKVLHFGGIFFTQALVQRS